jgi:hypothetical protein
VTSRFFFFNKISAGRLKPLTTSDFTLSPFFRKDSFAKLTISQERRESIEKYQDAIHHLDIYPCDIPEVKQESAYQHLHASEVVSEFHPITSS